MNFSSKPLQNPAVLSRKMFEGEMVLVNADTANSLALTNQTAVVVWEMVNGNNTVHDIITGVERQFQDVPDTVSSDVLDLLELLTQNGFIGFEWSKQT